MGSASDDHGQREGKRGMGGYGMGAGRVQAFVACPEHARIEAQPVYYLEVQRTTSKYSVETPV